MKLLNGIVRNQLNSTIKDVNRSKVDILNIIVVGQLNLTLTNDLRKGKKEELNLLILTDRQQATILNTYKLKERHVDLVVVLQIDTRVHHGGSLKGKVDATV